MYMILCELLLDKMVNFVKYVVIIWN